MPTATEMLKKILEENKVCGSHGINHATRVMTHVRRAIRCTKLKIPNDEQTAILLAALLHDADDRKFFPKNKNYENARKILSMLFPSLENRVIALIGLVSTSTNGSSVPEEAKERPWILWPRLADRLEACGWVGVVRCWDYSVGSSRPLFKHQTPRARDESELWKIATPQRYAGYKGDSPSMIDHYYDKLLHICNFESGNAYLDGEAEQRRGPMVEICLAYGKNGILTSATYEAAKSLVDSEFMRGG